MSMRVNREAYERLIEEDVEAMRLAMGEHSLEFRHAAMVLRSSVAVHYELAPAVQRVFRNIPRVVCDESIPSDVATIKEFIDSELGPSGA